MESSLVPYHVIYREANWGPLDADIFTCQAEDMEHAEEQCENAYPDAEILWVNCHKTAEETVQEWLNCRLAVD